MLAPCPAGEPGTVTGHKCTPVNRWQSCLPAAALTELTRDTHCMHMYSIHYTVEGGRPCGCNALHRLTITTHPLMIAVMQVLWHTCLGSCRTCSCWHRSEAHCPTCRHGRRTEEAGLCSWTSCTPWSVHEKHWSKKPANIYVHDYIHSHIILWWISIQTVLGWLDWCYTNKSEIPVYTNTNEFWILWIWLQALNNATYHRHYAVLLLTLHVYYTKMLQMVTSFVWVYTANCLCMVGWYIDRWQCVAVLHTPSVHFGSHWLYYKFTVNGT